MSLTPPLTRDVSPLKSTMAPPQRRHTLGFARQALMDWRKLQQFRSGTSCILDGNTLDIADVVAVAKYGAESFLKSDPTLSENIDQSIRTLYDSLNAGDLVYGVTTGFGGSADTRTTDTTSLQRALIQMQTTGILTSSDIGRAQRSSASSYPANSDDFDSAFDIQSMPTSWVRASMLTRCNTIIRGHSAVRIEIAENILSLLRHEITPIVPLRGSISASGDLSPLSYIAGALEGNPDIFVRVGKGTGKIITAEQALKEVGITPVILRAKEGLGLLNGTAFSTATASLALHQTQEIAIMAQILTAMSTEALQGTAESFHPRIAEMRPHPGQIEAAANILSFLSNSKLARGVQGVKDTQMKGLYQDRYALRTSSQWIGPQLEDLHQAHEQLLIELNSTTDNPLIDTDSGHILHGGNFQAAVVTSVMDRTRLALDKFGRMLFAQATEMINPTTNNGLPANLSSDDPSLSFTCKGIDINMAAYASELAFLANPVGNHVMSAEMHNQSINSVALISSRYTFQALDTIRILCAAHLYSVCQALDLRVQQVRFLELMRGRIADLVHADFEHDLDSELVNKVCSRFYETWPTTMTADLAERAFKTAESLMPVIVANINNNDIDKTFASVLSFMATVQKTIIQTYTEVQISLNSSRLTIVPSYLGDASRAVYTFIRSSNGLGVAFHRGLVEHPTHPQLEGWSVEQAVSRKTIGSSVSIIYEALKDGRMSGVAMQMVSDVLCH